MSEAQFDKLKHLGRLKMVLVFIAFVVPVAFSILHLGFYPETISQHSDKKFLSAEMLFVINVFCGLFGGFVMTAGKKIPEITAGIISGGVTTFTITSAALIYFFWRTSFINIEIIIPIGAGIIIGVSSFKLLIKLFS